MCVVSIALCKTLPAGWHLTRTYLFSTQIYVYLFCFSLFCWFVSFMDSACFVLSVGTMKRKYYGLYSLFYYLFKTGFVEFRVYSKRLRAFRGPLLICLLSKLNSVVQTVSVNALKESDVDVCVKRLCNLIVCSVVFSNVSYI